jgi:formylglycine-generating enzyme required for sulfatase activity
MPGQRHARCGSSPYGTFDQGGNVFEWNDAVVAADGRGLRGGSIFPSDSGDLRANLRFGAYWALEDSNVGFRVASIPEPSMSLLLMTGLLGLGAQCSLRRKPNG